MRFRELFMHPIYESPKSLARRPDLPLYPKVLASAILRALLLCLGSIRATTRSGTLRIVARLRAYLFEAQQRGAAGRLPNTLITSNPSSDVLPHRAEMRRESHLALAVRSPGSSALSPRHLCDGCRPSPAKTERCAGAQPSFASRLRCSGSVAVPVCRKQNAYSG